MSNEPPDKPDRGDIAHALAKALLNTVPLVGGSAAERLDLVRLPVMKRQHSWLTDLAERLRALEAEGRLRVEDLPNNEAFVDAMVRALDGDLGRVGLTNTGEPTGGMISHRLTGTMSNAGWQDSRTSDLGKRFFQFIAEP